MLTRDRPSSRKGNRLCQPQGCFTSAAIGDDRADVAPGKCVSEQPLTRFDEPVVQSRIPFEGRAGLFPRQGRVMEIATANLNVNAAKCSSFSSAAMRANIIVTRREGR